MTTASTRSEFFEAKYAAAVDHDPWRFASDAYEQERYRTMLSLLGDERFDRALEPGCSIGTFTRLLAARCTTVIAIDFAPTAIAEAAGRNADLEGVTHRVGSFPEWPCSHGGRFDLVCFLELGYYFDRCRLGEVAETVGRELLTDGGVVLAGHWTGSSPDHVLSGDEVHDVLDRSLSRVGLRRDGDRRRHTGFVADLWRRG